MLLARLKVSLRSFCKETCGTITLETVIVLPLLFWSAAATFEFFEVHRYKSVREKATYTVADMISRETSAAGLNSVYLDNAKILFDEISNDAGVNQIRVSIVTYDGVTDEYGISWSQVRGTGSLAPLTDGDVQNAHSELPIVPNGEEFILVESKSTYDPLFTVGLTDVDINTRTFTAVRAPQKICYEGQCALLNS